MTGKQRRKRLTFLPYPFEPLGLRLAVEVLGVPAEVDTHNGTTKLDELTQWEHIDIVASIEAGSDRCRALAESGDARLYATLRCRATRWRDAIVLEHADGQWRGTRRVRRHDVRDLLEVSPNLVAAAQLGSNDARRGQLVAAGRSWLVRLDPHRSRSAGYLQIRFRSFSDSADIDAPGDALFWLDADSAEPILWLNEDHDEAMAVLQAQGTRGAAARVRDIAFDNVSTAVWTELFVRALEGYDAEGEPGHAWHHSVLETLGPDLFPEVPAADIVAKVLAERDYVGTAHLVSKVIVALQLRHDFARHLTRLTQEVVE